ncbi:DUF6282 family protein [Haladaptatus halobius]|uniref:DUF6282 family protein n=1 Tax=Haladaptatus halobius TaxID=2884875 RepID=UPI001D09A6E5|nr:DUF6282 family protein [Haladaptatus halobius]
MTVDALIAGSWDTHVHASPDVRDRKHDVVELARRASDADMGGLVLKNHHFPTAADARIVTELPDIDVNLASTIVLNRFVGGINTDAVVAAAEMGVTRVELPTMTAKRNMLDQGETRTIDLLAEDGTLTDSTRAVVDEALEREMVIGTGHIGVDEVTAVVEYVTDAGGNVIITHPEFHAARDGEGLTPADQKRLATDGVYFERCFIVVDESVRSLFHSDAPEAAHDAFRTEVVFENIVAGIEATGPARNLLSTDYGQPGRESPPDALGAFHARLRDAGVPKSALEQMARDNPEALFGGS